MRSFSYLSLFALSALAGCGSPLVGLECRDGFERCDNACYDFSSDPQHCGGCDIACSVGQVCVSGGCMTGTPQPDGGDGGGGDGGLGDGSTDGRVGDGALDIDANLLPDGSIILPDGAIQLPDGMIVGPPGDGGGGNGNDGGDATVTVPPVPCTGPGSPSDCICGLGVTKCDPPLICVDTLTDRNHCGDCDTVCQVGFFCDQGNCAQICSTPTTFCNGNCVNFDTDDFNCGSCGRACGQLAACINGDCVGQAIGHVVAIGHDMSGPVRQPIRQLVGNSVFLSQSNPTRVLVYDAASTLASRSGVSEHIRLAADNIGRRYTLSTALPATVTQQLGTADVFVIATQQAATDSELVDLGVAWSAALADFTFRGGVVILFDGGPDIGDLNLGTWQILKSATVSRGGMVVPLLDVSATQFLSQRVLRVRDPADAIAPGVPNLYQSQGETVGFFRNQTPNLTHTDVVIDDQGLSPSNLPTAIHVILGP